VQQVRGFKTLTMNKSDLGVDKWCTSYLDHLIESRAKIPETGEQLDSNLDGAKSGSNLTITKYDTL